MGTRGTKGAGGSMSSTRSTKHGRARDRRQHRYLILLTCIATAASWLVALPAEAAVSCIYSSPKVTLNMNLGSGTETAGLTRSGNNIMWGTGTNPAAYTTQCGTATVTNTDELEIVGGGAANTFVLDMTNGAFAPGATNESGAVDEIELKISFSGGTDTVQINGCSTACGTDPLTGNGFSNNDRIVFGNGNSDKACNLNAAETTDDDD